MNIFIRSALMALALCLVVAAQTTQQCALSVHAIVVRGAGPGDHLQVLSSVRDLIQQKIPGSTVVALPYRHEDEDVECVRDGALLMQQYVRDYVASCPDAKIVLFGYSLGGMVTMEAVCGTSSPLLLPILGLEEEYNKNVISTIVYGDVSHFPFMPWNVGTCTGGLGLYPRLGIASCRYYQDSMRSYCDNMDQICCVASGDDTTDPHHAYFDKYDEDVVEYIQTKLANAT